MKVYVLQHTHTVNDEEDVKLLGVYSSASQANEAIARFCKRPGFADAQDGFSVDEYTLDDDTWVEGYVSWESAK